MLELAKYYTDLIAGKIKPKRNRNVLLENVNLALQNSVDWFSTNRNANASFGHWRWEVWDTANAILALLSCRSARENLENSVEFVLKNQRDDGGFFYENLPPSRKDLTTENAYCTETTSVVLQSLYSYFNEITPEIRDGINFLLKKQMECGGWELPYLLEEKTKVDILRNYYPSVTGYALQALLVTNSCSDNVLRRALDFLEGAQKKDGSWGKSTSYYNTESYAIKNIVKAFSLAKMGGIPSDLDSRMNSMLERCIKYTEKRQLADGSWPIRPHTTGRYSKAFSTSLYFQSLLYGGNRDCIDRGVFWILSNQRRDGSWKGGFFFIIKKDSFVTSEMVLCLNKYKNLLLGS
jgi:squalene cyclase